MSRINPFRYLIFILIFSLAACTQSVSVTTPQVVENPAYTAAAETINAQLTGISLPTQTPAPQKTADSTQPGSEANQPTPTETLPNTSTPEPTRTPQPSETPIAPATSEPTATTQSVATLQPTTAGEDPKADLGEPDWKDSFTNAANWPIYSDEHMEMWLQNGSLMMKALNNDKYEGWMITSAQVEDVYLEASFTTGDCSGLDRYGLLVRAPDATQGYLFGFTCDGRYAIRIWNGQGFSMLTDWNTSEHINKGSEQTNLLGVKAVGDQLSLYANDKLVTQVNDSTFTNGSFGLFAGAFLTPGFTVEISEIAYWILP